MLLPAILLLAGCTDSMDSLTREMRNANNESIDAMTQITDEESAERMNQRVLKPMAARYKDIEKRLVVWQSNRSPQEQVEQTFGSDGVCLCIVELKTNRERYNLEKIRLSNLYQQYQDRELQRLKDAGDPAPVIADPRVLCPNLHDLVMQEQFKSTKEQLINPKLKQMIASFPTLKVNNYPELHKKFLKRLKKFTPDVQIVLAQ
jgi:hypothetical protein